MGVRTPVSTNPAMTLGAFKQGVSVLDWAHAYESFATGGKRVYGSLGAPDEGPVGIREVRRATPTARSSRATSAARERVLPADVAALTTAQMQTVVSAGHRQARRLRRLRGRQDRHDRELRRRVVRRLHARS